MWNIDGMMAGGYLSIRRKDGGIKTCHRNREVGCGLDWCSAGQRLEGGCVKGGVFLV